MKKAGVSTTGKKIAGCRDLSHGTSLQVLKNIPVVAILEIAGHDLRMFCAQFGPDFSKSFVTIWLNVPHGTRSPNSQIGADAASPLGKTYLQFL